MTVWAYFFVLFFSSFFLVGLNRQRSEMHIIDLDKTAVALEKALHLIRGVVDARGTILFVNTRPQVRIYESTCILVSVCVCTCESQSFGLQCVDVLPFDTILLLSCLHLLPLTIRVCVCVCASIVTIAV